MSICTTNEKSNLSTSKISKTLILLAGIGLMTVQAALANPSYSPIANRSASFPVQQNRVNTSLAVALPRVSMIASRNNLPPTRLDSFVRSAGGNAEAIYGDEGTYYIPPYKGFSYEHRINAGIVGQSDAGLTTGHGSYLPSATGADEFLAPPGEWSQSGANYGQPRLNHADAALNIADQMDVTMIVVNDQESNRNAISP
jgi:hypothetical protein